MVRKKLETHETGIANVILNPDVFEQNRLVLVNAPFLYVEGTLQNVDDVVSVKASRLAPLESALEANLSHDLR